MGAGLDGGALSVRAWLLLAAGTAGGLAFTGVYLAEGATRVWVTPQIPFVVLMAGGAIVGVLAGSLAFDLFAAL